MQHPSNLSSKKSSIYLSKNLLRSKIYVGLTIGHTKDVYGLDFLSVASFWLRFGRLLHDDHATSRCSQPLEIFRFQLFIQLFFNMFCLLFLFYFFPTCQRPRNLVVEPAVEIFLRKCSTFSLLAARTKGSDRDVSL